MNTIFAWILSCCCCCCICYCCSRSCRPRYYFKVNSNLATMILHLFHSLSRAVFSFSFWASFLPNVGSISLDMLSTECLFVNARTYDNIRRQTENNKKKQNNTWNHQRWFNDVHNKDDVIHSLFFIFFEPKFVIVVSLFLYVRTGDYPWGTKHKKNDI